jgi:hypothetical protein
MSIARKTWIEVREAYVRGEGSLRNLADRFHLNAGTIERRASKEGWTAMRNQRENAALAQLVPVMPPPPAPLEVPKIEITAEWLEQRQAAHYAENVEFVTKSRHELTRRLESPEQLETDELARLTEPTSHLILRRGSWPIMRAKVEEIPLLLDACLRLGRANALRRNAQSTE